MRVAQPSIIRSARAGHGRTMNVHRESKGENIGENYAWMRGQGNARPAPQSTTKPPQAAKPSAKPAKDPQTNTKPKSPAKGGVANGKADHAVDGNDLSGKFKFSNDPSAGYSIEQVIKAQGFDGKPTLTSDATAFAAACKASNFIAKRGISASNQATLDAYDNDLKHGEFYVKCSGGSVHGYGMYAASVAANGSASSRGIRHAEQTAQAYAGHSRTSKVYTMTLDKTAKIGDEDALSRQMHKDTAYKQMCSASGMNQRYAMDVGCYAAFKGYDAYIAGNGRSGHAGGSSDYTVILNRSKVIIFDDSNI